MNQTPQQQPSLFDQPPARRSAITPKLRPKRAGQSEQAQNLARVSANISGIVLDFCREQGSGARFHMEELTKYVRERNATAPDSAGRILRNLRQKELVDYTVIDRGASLYELMKVDEVELEGVA